MQSVYNNNYIIFSKSQLVIKINIQFYTAKSILISYCVIKEDCGLKQFIVTLLTQSGNPIKLSLEKLRQIVSGTAQSQIHFK